MRNRITKDDNADTKEEHDNKQTGTGHKDESLYDYLMDCMAVASIKVGL
jgi:hypothetical protein